MGFRGGQAIQQFHVALQMGSIRKVKISDAKHFGRQVRVVGGGWGEEGRGPKPSTPCLVSVVGTLPLKAHTTKHKGVMGFHRPTPQTKTIPNINPQPSLWEEIDIIIPVLLLNMLCIFWVQGLGFCRGFTVLGLGFNSALSLYLDFRLQGLGPP